MSGSDENQNTDHSDDINESDINTPDSNDPENEGEFLLKSAALTMTSKGISQDLKDVIKMKTDFVSQTYSDIIKLSESFLKHGDKNITKDALSKGGVLNQYLEHILGEIAITNITLNNILVSFVSKDQSIQEEKKKLIESDLQNLIEREITKLKK